MIARSSEDGVKFTTFVSEINCVSHQSRVIENLAYGIYGQELGPIPIKYPTWHPIKEGTTGVALYDVACTQSSMIPDSALPIMLPTAVVADQIFRFLSLGLSSTAASLLAAADPVKAPKSFNDLLQILVPADRQRVVLAIKTPDAPM